MYEFSVGDIVTLKKPHPCGSYRWKLMKNGIDVTIKCEGCNRVVKLNRMVFNKRIKKIEKMGETSEV